MNSKKKPHNSERHISQGFADLEAGDTVTYISADDATDLYFGVAFSALLSLSESDKLHPHVRSFRVREDVISVCVLSFLSLESAINLLFHETFTTNIRPIKTGIPNRVVQHIKHSWNDQGLSIKDKYLLLPPMMSDFEFDPGSHPFQLFDEFVSFRNGLVHAKARTQRTTIRLSHVENTSSSGEVLDHAIDTPEPEHCFPCTKFSTTFGGLSRTDAEKAFEIAYRMRVALNEGTLCAPLSVLFADVESGSHYLTATAIAKELCKIFTPHFGTLP
jgi:hypothetical protein